VMTGILTQAQYQQFLIIAANIVYPGAGTAIQLGLLSLHAIAGDRMDYGRALASIAASAAVQYLGGKLCDACGYPAGIAGPAAVLSHRNKPKLLLEQLKKVSKIWSVPNHFMS